VDTVFKEYWDTELGHLFSNSRMLSLGTYFSAFMEKVFGHKSWCTQIEQLGQFQSTGVEKRPQ